MFTEVRDPDVLYVEVAGFMFTIRETDAPNHSGVFRGWIWAVWLVAVTIVRRDRSHDEVLIPLGWLSLESRVYDVLTSSSCSCRECGQPHHGVLRAQGSEALHGCVAMSRQPRTQATRADTSWGRAHSRCLTHSVSPIFVMPGGHAGQRQK